MSRKRHKHTDTAADGKVLSWCLDDGVTEEEDGRDNSTDNHGISTAEKLDFSQTGCDKRTEDGADVGDGIVAPCLSERGHVVRKTASDEGSSNVSSAFCKD